MAYKVLIPQMIAREGINYLENCGYEIINGSGATEEDLIRDVKDCDAILLRTAPVTRRVLEKGSRLKVVARHGSGYNNVDLKAAEELGIWVTNAPDSTTKTVGEFVLGALLAIAKKTFLMNKKMAEGDFFYKNTHKGIDAEGKTLAVIGFGRIGREVARKAYAALNMKILAYDPYIQRDCLPEYVEMTDFDTALEKADFVTLHMPLTAKNHKMIGKREFDKMKSGVCFLNCARGEIVDEEALIAALQSKHIGAAFLDVLNEEPPRLDNPLFHMENVILTPHMASNTEECMTLMAVQAASQIHCVLSGKRPDWPVNHPQNVRTISS